MKAKFIPVTVIEVIDMLISGKEKLAVELINELRWFTIREKYII